MIKRILLTTIVLISSMMTYAQIKVAILPATDKTGEVKYGLRLLLTSSITSAISLTEGYEAYDRIDLSSVMDEQTFQRTGMVSDTEIHKIGEMTGASFVLITEAAYIDENHVVATAKIVNVESAKIANSAVGMMDVGNSEKLLNDCKNLTDKLLKGSTEAQEEAQTNETNSTNIITTTSKNSEKSPQTVSSETNTPINLILNEAGNNNNNDVSQDSELKPVFRQVQVLYSRKGKLYLEKTGVKLSSFECSDILGNDLYNQYKIAHGKYNLGKTFKIIGMVFVAAGIADFAAGGSITSSYTSTGYGGYYHEETHDYTTACINLGLGVASFVPGIIVQKKAARRIDNIVDKNNYGNNSSSMLGFSPLLMLTAQNNMCLGVSLAFSF